MAMGTRETDQPPLWIATSDLPTSPGHPFYARLTTLLDGHHFDRFVEGLCDRFYAPVMGRPSLAPGRYFRLLLVGYFEGIDSERGIAWRAADSLAVRSFLRLAVDEAPPDHSTIARTRRLIDLETHRTVFTWVQQRLVEAGRLKGKTIAIDATTLEANAAMRSIVRRDTGESYQAFLAGLAKASGIETPTREGLARLDRKRKKKTSNKDWTNPHDPDAKVTKMKDGRTHLAHKAEHAVDMETGAIVAVTLQGADVGDTTTIIETAIAAAEQVEDAQANVDDRQSLEEIVGDKGYHSNQTLIDLDAVGIRSYVSEPDRGRRDWSKDPEARAPVYGNRRRMRGRRGRRLMRQRGERIERSFAHLYDTGGMRRTHLRGHTQHPEAPPDSCGWLQSRARHASSDRDRHAARAAGPRGRCSCDVRGAHGRRPTSAHHDFVVASTHPGRARSARVTGHVCRQLVSGDHLHHGLLGLRARERDGDIVSPRIFATGGMVTVPGGHGGRPGATLVDSWPEAIPALDAHIAREPDLVKLTFDEHGWGTRPLIPLLPVDLMRKVGAYFNEHGIRTTVHISHEYRARQAIDAGINTLAHPVIQGPVSEGFVELMATTKTPMVSTLTIGEGYSRLVEHPEFLDQPLYQAVLEPARIELLRTRIRDQYAARAWTTWMKVMTPVAQENLRQISAAGGIIVLGSDQSSGPASHRELELMVEGGIPALEAIRIGTLNAAVFLGREGDMGSIEEGKLADLVLLDADPLENISNAQRIHLVIKGGRIIDRGALDVPANR